MLWMSSEGFRISEGYVEGKGASMTSFGSTKCELIGFTTYKTSIKGLSRTEMNFIFLSFIECNRM